MATCGINDCENPQEDRGVCAEHLTILGQQVDAGKFTWEQYESADVGVCAPKKTPTKLCVTVGCGVKANARGLCLTCYAAALRFMKVKGLQWYDLEQVGASLPGRKRRSEGSSLFRINTEKLMNQERQMFIPPFEPAPPEQTVSVTQDQPFPAMLSEEECEDTIQGVQPQLPMEVHKTLQPAQKVQQPEIIPPFIPTIPDSIEGETQEAVVKVLTESTSFPAPPTRIPG